MLTAATHHGMGNFCGAKVGMLPSVSTGFEATMQ